MYTLPAAVNFDLKIYPKPDVSRSVTDYRCSDGIKVTWSKLSGGSDADPNRVQQLPYTYQVSYIINNVQKGDEGLYQCTGQGQAGQTSVKFQLVVQGKLTQGQVINKLP